MSEDTKKLIFYLYIIENGLNEEKIKRHMEDPKVASELQGIPYETIIAVANAKVKEMNREIGYDIY